ncbi:MAG TPA: hypoxanthine phosphoribosyltransferase [Saprospiraceae bacterium]|nr:hypoxanthine phosphoribosyltransferase [Saprospiraceae bacterium]HMP24262.1 hypoxanthine phosphoribosyltransferase [Saprospiraceae bacterium]
MKSTFQAHDLLFEEIIDQATIAARVRELGNQLHTAYQDKNPLFIGVLNGAFIFAADLIRASGITCEIDFVRMSSYRGLESSGAVEVALESKIDIAGRHLIVVEDIVDTGNTLTMFCEALQRQRPASVAIAAMLVKPDALQHPLQVDFVGFNIPPAFVIGYGLDYNEQGRHLPGIYQLRQAE